MGQAHEPERLRRSILFDDWQAAILLTTDTQQLVHVVRGYLAAWGPEQLTFLPWDLGATALANSEDIAARAILAGRLETKSDGKGEQYFYLREMALTLAAAATRLRFLKAVAARASNDQGRRPSPALP